ncbi:MAG: hypothetical protein WA082_01340 [Candidatus Moraniibacteriota bacterium]
MTTFEGKPIDDETLRKESIRAVREGRALPTPEFAIKEGGEMLTALAVEIGKLDLTQIEALQHALKRAQNAADPMAIKEAIAGSMTNVEESENGLSVGQILSGMVAFALGSYFTNNAAVGVLAASGVIYGMSAIEHTWTKQEHQKVLERVGLLAGLLDEAKRRQESVEK